MSRPEAWGGRDRAALSAPQPLPFCLLLARFRSPGRQGGSKAGEGEGSASHWHLIDQAPAGVTLALRLLSSAFQRILSGPLRPDRCMSIVITSAGLGTQAGVRLQLPAARLPPPRGQPQQDPRGPLAALPLVTHTWSMRPLPRPSLAACPIPMQWRFRPLLPSSQACVLPGGRQTLARTPQLRGHR